jgi:hypothetical protein
MCQQKVAHCPKRRFPHFFEIAMPPAWDQVQLCSRNALYQQVGIGSRVHLVVASVDDQRGRADAG